MWFFDTPGTPGAGSIVERIFLGSKQPLCKSCFQGSNSYVSRTTITIPFNKLLYYRPLRTIEYWVELYFTRIPLPCHDPLCLQILFGLLLLLMEAEKIWQNFEMHRSCNLETKIWMQLPSQIGWRFYSRRIAKNVQYCLKICFLNWFPSQLSVFLKNKKKIKPEKSNDSSILPDFNLLVILSCGIMYWLQCSCTSKKILLVFMRKKDFEREKIKI